MLNTFLERLDTGPLIADGAIGTLLHERSVPWGTSLDQVTLTDRPLVLQMHLDYLRAGAELMTTNTFGANRERLAEFGLADRVRDINLHAVKIAREAREISGTQSFVAGAVGQIGRPGRMSQADAQTTIALSIAYREQIAALLEGGADIILLETFTNVRELELAVQISREVCRLPVIASMSFDADGRTSGDLTPEAVGERLLELGVEVAGINCSVGPQAALDVLMRMRSADCKHVSVMPNAGLPSRRGQNFLYLSTPQYFAEYACRFIDAGALIVGGCCGTSPHHVAAMATALESRTPCRKPFNAQIVERGATQQHTKPVPVPEKPTRLKEALLRGDFVVSVELAPPKGVNPEKVLVGARLLAEHGLHFVNITDSAMARVRMGAIAIAKLVQETTSLEAIIHYTTRDRNLMALQSDLIGAHAMGVRNVLALTGDPPSVGDYPDATGVWDVESMGLIETLNQMNANVDLRGRDIGGAAGFCVGCAVNPTADDLDVELERFQKKLDAGAHFVMSQPVYDVATLEQFLDRVGPLPVPFLLGVLPLQSHRHAEYMHNEVPGIVVPDHMRDAMQRAGANGVQHGIDLAQQLIAETQTLVQGIYLMPSFGRYEICAQVIEALDSDRHPATLLAQS